MAQQAHESDHQQRGDHADGGAEEARRVGLEGETPPDLAGVLGVLVHKDAEPHRRTHHHQDSQHPSALERRGADGRPAVEVPARRKHGREHDRQDGRFLPVRPLEQRCDDADPEKGDGEAVRRVEPVPERPCQHEQAGTRQAPHEVAQLDEPQRENVTQPGKPFGHAGRGARDQQDGSGEEHRSREHLGNQSRDPFADAARRTQRPRRVRQGLVHPDHDDRCAERQQVVDDAVGDQCPEEVRGADVRLEQEHHDRLDDAETTRHVTHETGELRQEKDAEEREKGEPVPGREQDVEHRRRQGPVEGRDE